MNREELIEILASRITGVRREHPIRVAIDGVDASGKTTLADELVTPLQAKSRSVIRASIDGFHNPPAVRKRRGDISPEGYYHDSFDYAGLATALLEPLGPGGSRRYRRAIFDFRTDSTVEVPIEKASLNAILLFDGIFLLRSELRNYWDYSIFVWAEFDLTVKRAEARDGELFGGKQAIRFRYEQRYVPGQQLYLSDVRPELLASVVIQNNDPANPAILHAS